MRDSKNKNKPFRMHDSSFHHCAALGTSVVYYLVLPNLLVFFILVLFRKAGCTRLFFVWDRKMDEVRSIEGQLVELDRWIAEYQAAFDACQTEKQHYALRLKIHENSFDS